MALTNASRLADFGTGIGTQGAILKVDNADQMVGIGTTDPTSKLEVKGDFKVSAASTLSGAVKISDSTNSTSTTTGALIVTGGVGIGASLHVDGDVSIGGTLTYEDVTNIDSVGLITARSGINVSGGEFKVGTALTVGSAGVTTISARVYIRSSFPRLDLEDTDSDSDFAIINSNGDFMVWDQTNSANRFSINSSGVVAANSDLEVAGSQYITDSIIHTGDTNTKIRFPAADTITAETGGSERLRITSGGDVGINTTVPAQKLHVYGNSGNTILAVGDNSTVQPYVLLEANETDNVCTLHSRTNNALTFKINNSERARIDASGQLGIGTNSPSAQFVVSNSGNNGFEFNPNFNSNNSIIASYNRNPATDDYTQLTLSASQHIFAKGGTEYGRFNANGRLGIGTNNPQLNLHIHSESSNASFAHFTNSTTGVSGSDGVSIGLDSDENAVIYNYESSAIRFATGGTERARITSDGTVGVGEDDPDGNTLLIRAASTVQTAKGHIMLTGDSATVGQGPQIVFSESGGTSQFAGAYIGHMREGSNSVGNLVFGTRETGGDANTVPTERLRITSAGLVGLGTDNPTAYLSFLAKRSTQTMPPICFQSSYGTSLADAAISTTDDTGGTDVMMGSNVYMGQNGTFVKYSASYGSAAVRCQYTGNTLFYNKSGNNNPVESFRITGSGYREIRNYHYGAYAFTDNSAKTTITIGDPGDGKFTTVRFLLTIEDVSYRQSFWQGEYTVFVSNANGGPGVNYYLKEHWQQVGSTNWSGGSVTVAMSGGAVQVTATNSNNDAAGDIFVHILQVVGDNDGSTVASIS